MLLVRQVRLELTIPCLRGRCLDPIWLLTQYILDFRFFLADWSPLSGKKIALVSVSIKNQKSKINNELAGLTRLELAISASTVQRFDPTKLQPRRGFLICDF
jgi:hypothetical protein